MTTDTRERTIERAAIKQDGMGLLIRRWIATWIDFAVLAAGLLVLLFAPSTLAGGPNRASQAAIYLTMVVGLVFPFAYYIISEALWGRTLGKLVCGIVVVGSDGQKPGFGRALLRTLTRVIEVNPFLVGGLPAGIICLFSEKNRRLGDMAADTYVMPLKVLRDAKAKDAAVFD
jgi:uncharacterized RDD family membrane protein YckC